MKGMTLIVKTISSWVKVLIFLFGIYIILFGDLGPGGGGHLSGGGLENGAPYPTLRHGYGCGYAKQVDHHYGAVHADGHG